MDHFADPSTAALMRRHPCFDEHAHARVGRVHLPVAPRCNIRCRFCERRICANLTVQHPGWARQLLTPDQALARVRRLVHQQEEATPRGRNGSFVVGVAGPGEPLANPETLQTLRLVHREFPSLVKCISTNGLVLEEALPELLDAGVRTLTVTVNAPTGAVGEKVYAWVRCEGKLYRGRDAAECLIARQMRGIRAAVEARLAVKVNTVLIPGVNDRHMEELAARVASLGVHLMNIMPLIPGGDMRDHRAPTCDELRGARDACERVIPQFRVCQQCSADVIRFPRRAARLQQG